MKKKQCGITGRRTMNAKKISDDESYESFNDENRTKRHSNARLYSSTPTKMENRRSMSLLDLSDIEIGLDKSKVNANSEISSNSSLCKDSGFHNSVSSLASEKIRQEPSSDEINSRYMRLLEEVKFKDVMIAALQESNQNLRMKFAEAENKISELRLKCESHCNCCSFKNEGSATGDYVHYKKVSKSRSEALYCRNFCVSPVIHEEQLSVSPFNESRTVVTSSKEPVKLPNDGPFDKVKRWQESYRDTTKRLLHQIPPSIPPAPLDHRRLYVRPVPTPVSHQLEPLTYMETSRALAEAYKGRRGPLRFQLIGDRSISVTPVHPPAPLPIDLTSCESDDGREELRLSPEEIRSTRFAGFNPSQGYLHSKHPPESSTLFNRILLNHQKSIALFDCLNKATEYATNLNQGLSKLRPSLENIKSLTSNNLD